MPISRCFALRRARQVIDILQHRVPAGAVSNDAQVYISGKFGAREQYRSALQGMGDTLTPMLSGLAELVMRTGAALLLPALIGYSGVFWAEILAWIGADLLLIPSYYATYHKYERRSQKAEPPAQ